MLSPGLLWDQPQAFHSRSGWQHCAPCQGGWCQVPARSQLRQVTPVPQANTLSQVPGRTRPCKPHTGTGAECPSARSQAPGCAGFRGAGFSREFFHRGGNCTKMGKVGARTKGVPIEITTFPCQLGNYRQDVSLYPQGAL